MRLKFDDFSYGFVGNVKPDVSDKTPPRLPGWFPRLCTTPKSEAVFIVQKRWDHPDKRGGGSSVADVKPDDSRIGTVVLSREVGHEFVLQQSC